MVNGSRHRLKHWSWQLGDGIKHAPHGAPRVPLLATVACWSQYAFHGRFITHRHAGRIKLFGERYAIRRALFTIAISEDAGIGIQVTRLKLAEINGVWRTAEARTECFGVSELQPQ